MIFMVMWNLVETSFLWLPWWPLKCTPCEKCQRAVFMQIQEKKNSVSALNWTSDAVFFPHYRFTYFLFSFHSFLSGSDFPPEILVLTFVYVLRAVWSTWCMSTVSKSCKLQFQTGIILLTKLAFLSNNHIFISSTFIFHVWFILLYTMYFTYIFVYLYFSQKESGAPRSFRFSS